MIEILVALVVVFFCLFIFYYAYSIYQESAEPKQDTRPGYKKEVEYVDEYSRLLDLFGLDDTATTEEIKSAYRQYMREHHPDTAEEKSAEETEKFIELKKAYERILKIKEGRFGA